MTKVLWLLADPLQRLQSDSKHVDLSAHSLVLLAPLLKAERENTCGAVTRWPSRCKRAESKGCVLGLTVVAQHKPACQRHTSLSVGGLLEANSSRFDPI